MSYRNVDNWVVIEEDDRDPATSWQNHLDRGSSGGVDVVAKFRTPIHAPDDATVYLAPDNGTGGNTVTLVYADGWRDQFMHLDEFVGQDGKPLKNGQRVSQGEQVGLSGRSGEKGRYTYAPHVHWHRIDLQGRRRNPWNYFVATAGNADGPVVVPNDPPKKRKPFMHVLIVDDRGLFMVVKGDGTSARIDSEPKRIFWEKVICDQRGIAYTPGVIKAVEVSGQEWDASGL